MKVTIIGSGKMAEGISIRLLSGGHSVFLHAREIEKARELASELNQKGHGGSKVEVDQIGSKIADEVVIFALPYQGIFPVIEQYRDQLEGRILVDITNPIDYQTFEMLTPTGSSAAEEIAKLTPKGTKVVKAFNTTFAGTLVNGQVNGQPLDVFIAGDDAGAKATIAKFVEDGGMRAIDAGNLNRSRHLESVQFIHIYLNLQKQLGFNFMSTVKLLS